MSRVLLDTDILSEVNKAKDPIVVGHAHRYLLAHGRLTFSTVTVMEIVAGYSRRGSEDKLRRFLEMAQRSEVLPLDTTAAELAGRMHADLQRAGLDIGGPDTMIAAIAVRDGLPLVTGNKSDYERVQQIGYPLQLSNWRTA